MLISHPFQTELGSEMPRFLPAGGSVDVPIKILSQAISDSSNGLLPMVTGSFVVLGVCVDNCFLLLHPQLIF